VHKQLQSFRAIWNRPFIGVIFLLVSSGQNEIPPLLAPPGKNPSDTHDYDVRGKLHVLPFSSATNDFNETVG